jgi:hypothetical protein
MKKEIKKISSGKDLNIGILYYIRHHVALDIEIGRVIAGQDIDIRIFHIACFDR